MHVSASTVVRTNAKLVYMFFVQLIADIEFRFYLVSIVHYYRLGHYDCFSSSSLIKRTNRLHKK